MLEKVLKNGKHLRVSPTEAQPNMHQVTQRHLQKKSPWLVSESPCPASTGLSRIPRTREEKSQVW